MKNLTPVLLATLLISCTSKAIEPISNKPIPRQKAPLTVDAVSPHSGRFNPGGAKVSILGTGFMEGAHAFIGDKACLKTRVKSPSLIRCKLPEQEEPGDYTVTVVNPDGDIAPIELTMEEREQNRKDAIEDGEDYQDSDGLLYYHYIKPIGYRIANLNDKLDQHD
jgi:hypothetical protein